MRKRSLVVFLGVFFVLGGLAQAQVLTFEGLGDMEAIQGFYNGGTGSQGSSGPNLGISFSDGVLALIDSDAGGTGQFANEPSADTVGVSLARNREVMNVAGGFDTGFSFYYSANTTLAWVRVYDGLDGTGNLLAEINLADQYSDNCSGDPTGAFCNWTQAGLALDFGETALSVVFEGESDDPDLTIAGKVMFDNVTLGSTTPSVPEPSTLLLLGLGLAGIALTRRFS